MTRETVGPVEPTEPVHETTTTFGLTDAEGNPADVEVTLTTNVDMHPSANVVEGVHAVADAIIRERQQSPPASQ